MWAAGPRDIPPAPAAHLLRLRASHWASSRSHYTPEFTTRIHYTAPGVYRLAEAPNVALVLTPEEVELLIRLRRERQQFPLVSAAATVEGEGYCRV